MAHATHYFFKHVGYIIGTRTRFVPRTAQRITTTNKKEIRACSCAGRCYHTLRWRGRRLLVSSGNLKRGTFRHWLLYSSTIQETIKSCKRYHGNRTIGSLFHAINLNCSVRLIASVSGGGLSDLEECVDILAEIWIDYCILEARGGRRRKSWWVRRQEQGIWAGKEKGGEENTYIWRHALGCVWVSIESKAERRGEGRVPRLLE